MSFTLVAKFDISLNVPLLLKRAEDDPLLYQVQLADYDVSLRLTTNRSWALKGKYDKYWTVPSTAVEIRVSKKDIEPPPIDRLPDGTVGYESQRPSLAADVG